MLYDSAKIKELFNGASMSCLIGYSKAFTEYTTRPEVFKNVQDLDRLVLNHFCDHNLMTYHQEILSLVKRSAQTGQVVGVIVKPCDGKSFVELIRENRLKREDVVIFSAPCQGVIDVARLLTYKDNVTETVTGIEVIDGKVLMQSGGSSKEISLQDVLEDKCLRCRLDVSPLYDHLLGECGTTRSASLGTNPAINIQVDRAYWTSEYERCIRCGACRKVCPMCYCPNCILEQDTSKILSNEVNAKENGTYLLIRAMHLAGRCVDCGRCSQVCPVSIRHDQFHLHLSQYIADTFDFEAGKNSDSGPVLSEFRVIDKIEFPEI